MDLSSLTQYLKAETLVSGTVGAVLTAIVLGVPKALWRGGAALWQRRKDRKAEKDAEVLALLDLAERGKAMRAQQLMTYMRNALNGLPYYRRRAESPEVSTEDRLKAAQDALDQIEGALINARELADESRLVIWEKQKREFSAILERLQSAASPGG